jgi:hypothetical protein
MVERFLAGYSERTRHAYATDLEDFGRFRGQAQAAAIAELLASRVQGGRPTEEQTPAVDQSGQDRSGVNLPYYLPRRKPPRRRGRGIMPPPNARSSSMSSPVSI